MTREQQLLPVEMLMSRQEGRAVVYHWLTECGVFCDTFDADPVKHAVNAGRRQAGLAILDDVREAAYNNYLTMLRENETDD